MKINRLNSVFGCLFLVFCLFSLLPASGQSFSNDGQTLEISGHYTSIFRNGEPGKTNNFHFVVFNAAHGWSIAATNDNNPGDWGVMRSDGTNIYTLATYVGNSPLGHVNAYQVYGYVYPGQFYIPKMQDSVHLFLPWMSCLMSPQMVRSFQHQGVIEIPWPWGNTRFVEAGYGFKWVLKSSEANQIQRIDLVRDSTLDLKTLEDELHHPMIDYPYAISDREIVLQNLQIMKDIPNDFVFSFYECTETFQTNNVSIPSQTEFNEFYPDYKGEGSIVLHNYYLTMDGVKFLDNADIADATTPAETLVSDYRYQAVNGRTKFNCATYTLNPGDTFKPGNDPELLAQARGWLKHGSAFEGYKSKRGTILIGMLFITVISVGLLCFWSKNKSNQQQT